MLVIEVYKFCKWI